MIKLSKNNKLKYVSLDSIIEEEQEPFKNTYHNDSENIALEIQIWETEINKFGFDLEMLVDEAPKPVAEGVSKDEAQSIKEKIEAEGGSVEIK